MNESQVSKRRDRPATCSAGWLAQNQLREGCFCECRANRSLRLARYSFTKTLPALLELTGQAGVTDTLMARRPILFKVKSNVRGYR